ncbi:MAG TPA: serine/threonine-protein kinase [Polyangiaceae bacterium]|nr:serine/threonine-protein kinase [Polyangiaceae bacterium]
MTETTLRPGNKLGRFQLLVPIGSGGMGRVWVAREENTGRLFALKTTLGNEKAAGEYWNVLLDEARLAAQVQHRGVCTIHAFEIDEQLGIPYLVMDFSDGGSLYELLDASAGHRLEPAIAVSICAQLCDALQVAHDLCDEHGAQLGVVHRDVSPQNILISTSGHVQLTDFGVAKARGRLHAPTATGEIKGKLSYMAPEQVTQRDVDRRADVFALGCVLYEATVGERPFHGNDAVATLYQLLEQPLILPGARLKGYPSDLEAIVQKALERDPANRYQSAEELGSALSRWIANQGRLVTERDIAAVVNDRLGKSIAERAQRIALAENELDAPPPPPPTEQTLGGSSATTPGERARKSKLIGAGIAGGAVALALVISLAVRGSHEPEPALVASAGSAVVPSAPASATATTTTTTAATPTTTETPITVTLVASPARAMLYLDDGPALPNPHQLTVLPDSKLHHVRASAPGFADRTEDLLLDGSKEVRLALAALAPGTHAPLVKTKPSADQTHTSVPVPTSGDLPKVVTKRPRVLDPDNPFAAP